MASARCALFGREVGVARAERQAIRVAQGAQTDDLDRQQEIARHALDHLELLIVLATEHGHALAAHREQLTHDRGHAVEVTGAVRTAQRRGQAAHVHARALALRVHLARVRREHVGHARLATQLEIALERARVASKVFVRAELRGIDEDRERHFGARASAPRRRATNAPRAARPSWAPGRGACRRCARPARPAETRPRCDADVSVTSPRWLGRSSRREDRAPAWRRSPRGGSFFGCAPKLCAALGKLPACTSFT